ncbi:MAG: hypothetical protein KGZ40_02910 [Clostridiales bacterium]|nr:hypothetical protein [Clostridiales bacterium]
MKANSAGRANVYWLVRENTYVEQLVKPAFEFEPPEWEAAWGIAVQNHAE